MKCNTEKKSNYIAPPDNLATTSWLNWQGGRGKTWFIWYWLVKQNKKKYLAWVIDLSHIPLQCVWTIAPERGWGGHFHTFTVFLSSLTLTWRYCLLEYGKGLLTLLICLINLTCLYKCTKTKSETNQIIFVAFIVVDFYPKSGSPKNTLTLTLNFQYLTLSLFTLEYFS